jgi:hypothetical protein
MSLGVEIKDGMTKWMFRDAIDEAIERQRDKEPANQEQLHEIQKMHGALPRDHARGSPTHYRIPRRPLFAVSVLRDSNLRLRSIVLRLQSESAGNEDPDLDRLGVGEDGVSLNRFCGFDQLLQANEPLSGVFDAASQTDEGEAGSHDGFGVIGAAQHDTSRLALSNCLFLSAPG